MRLSKTDKENINVFVSLFLGKRSFFMDQIRINHKRALIINLLDKYLSYLEDKKSDNDIFQYTTLSELYNNVLLLEA